MYITAMVVFTFCLFTDYCCSTSKCPPPPLFPEILSLYLCLTFFFITSINLPLSPLSFFLSTSLLLLVILPALVLSLYSSSPPHFCLKQEYIPDLYNHFLNVGLEAHMYASQWFLTLFTAKFPLYMVFHIIDLLLCEVGNKRHNFTGCNSHNKIENINKCTFYCYRFKFQLQPVQFICFSIYVHTMPHTDRETYFHACKQ